jgi:hypothetical protein
VAARSRPPQNLVTLATARYLRREGDPRDHTPRSEYIDAIMSKASFQSDGCVLPEACGGAPCTSELGSPCGSPSRPIVSESDACRPSPPCQSSSTLRRGGLGTNGNILHVASGGCHSDASSDDPCGLKGLHPDWVRDACRHGPHGEPPSPCLELPCSNSCVLHAASGGSTMCPKSVDPCGCTAETENSCSPRPHRGHSNPTFNLHLCHPSWRPGFISRLWYLSRLLIATTPPFHPQSLLPPPSSPTPVA